MYRRLFLLLLALVLPGCMFQHMNVDEASRPDRAIGTGAHVVYPGESGPGMNSQGQATEPVRSAPSSQPGGSKGSTPSKGEPDLTMIGGTSQEVAVHTRNRKMPLIGPLTVLFGYPFWIFGKGVEEKAAEEAEKQQASQPQGQTETTPQDRREQRRVNKENEEMEREIRERRRTPRVPRPQSNMPEVAAGPPGGVSVANELAQLEQRLGRGTRRYVVPQREARLERPQETLDRNGDGKPDLWAYFDGPRRVREEIDDDHDGRAERILYYGPDGKVIRSKEDVDGDGRLETTSLYKDGDLVRKRADSDGDGESDSWSFYQQGKLARHEVDRDADGFRDLVLTYEAGELMREEEDRNHDGHPDLVILYRGGEIAERREDIDYDGSPDVDSFYEAGKLVRRELTSGKTLQGRSDQQWSGKETH